LRTDVSCPSSGDFCENTSCVPFSGCETYARVCANNNTDNDNSSCDTVKCNSQKKECELEEQSCFSFGVVGAVIGAGAAVGIAAGGILFLVLLGGGAYGAATLVGTEGENQVNSNPLFKPKSKVSEVAIFQQ
jgi:hypothetical protein